PKRRHRARVSARAWRRGRRPTWSTRRLAAAGRISAGRIGRIRCLCRAQPVVSLGEDTRGHLFHRGGDAMIWLRRIALIAALMIAAAPAAADDLVSGLSTDLIQITSNFTGADIV